MYKMAKCIMLSLLACVPSSAFNAGLPKTNVAVRSADLSRSVVSLLAKRRGQDYDEYDNEYEYDEDEDYNENADFTSRRRRRRKVDDLGSDESGQGLNLPSPFGRRRGIRLPEAVSKSLLAGVFVLGIGTGVTVDSAINTNPKDLASRDAVDRQAPNPTVCTAYGSSAMAFDQRVFVSFNPFNVFVAQADVKPACVLRSSNVSPLLKDEWHLINEKEVQSCKKNMNTWAFVGNLEDMPQLSCVYQSEDAQNEFLSNPKLGIGEDVWDDDRDKIASTKKMVKDVMTEGQLKKKSDAADALRKQGTDILSTVMK